MNRLLIAGTALAMLAACGTKRATNYDVADATADSSANVDELVAAADALWPMRGDAAKLQEAMDAYEAVTKADPTNRHALTRLTRGYYFLGDGHMSTEEDKMAAWDKAVVWGERCMGLNAELRAELEAGNSMETAATLLTVDDMPCAYWHGSALSKWAKMDGLATILDYKDQVKAQMVQVGVLDETYFYTASTRYFGAYYAALPSFAGQDLDKSQELFLKAIEANPDHFGNRVLYADYWATRTQDKAVFMEQLKIVLESDPAVIPDLQPEQEAEQRKAQALMDKAADLFVD